ncbi:hypothetical protein FB479_11640 [Brevibacillus sp. AG162]|uniref:hypothetical protein n=1 Tax=Brevibacillus sp. AG162 TaxID=2572910 RepID=UPI00114E8341|nr:hypothetical protein [Brevibacillus sp. AG162]TQK41939.1 hypothetical protein FB479_11640 [Brevibacillus sp. AG162]
MAEIVSGLPGSIPVKVPIPSRLLLIEDDKERSAAMRKWWEAYAARYPEFKADRRDKKFVYMVRRGGEQQ